jgi:hypothetical protein
MNIYISNFGRRIADYLRQNPRRVIIWIVMAIAGVAFAWLMIYGVERLEQWGYERGVEASEEKFQKANAEVRAAEARERALKEQIDILETEQRELEARADAAEKRRQQTQIVYRTVKEAYEIARDNPVVPACVSRADACSELAGVNHPCK